MANTVNFTGSVDRDLLKRAKVIVNLCGSSSSWPCAGALGARRLSRRSGREGRRRDPSRTGAAPVYHLYLASMSHTAVWINRCTMVSMPTPPLALCEMPSTLEPLAPTSIFSSL